MWEDCLLGTRVDIARLPLPTVRGDSSSRQRSGLFELASAVRSQSTDAYSAGRWIGHSALLEVLGSEFNKQASNKVGTQGEASPECAIAFGLALSLLQVFRRLPVPHGGIRTPHRVAYIALRAPRGACGIRHEIVEGVDWQIGAREVFEIQAS